MKVGVLGILGVFIWSQSVFAQEKTWQSKMNELSVAMSEVIPYLFPDPNKDVKGLNDKVKKIQKITQSLDVGFEHMQKQNDFDPALPYITNLFKEDIDRAYLALQDGHTEYAKSVLRSSTSYCIACHTRSDAGAAFPLLSAYAQPLKGASWITRIEFLAASRQVDTVLSDVMGQLSSSGAPGISSLDLERASRIALSIAIRVKRDPVKAALLAQAVTKSPQASFAMKQTGRQWLKDIQAWQKEKKTNHDSAEALLKAAQQLQATIKKDKMSGGHDEVNYLRSTVYIHELLKRFPKTDKKAEALYTLGMSYWALQDLGLWSLHDKYFRACIDEAPHTKQSERCYKEYEQSVILGFSGSSGTHIPSAVKKHLETIKKKAMPSGSPT